MSTLAPLVIFSHGKETGPWGTKIKHLASVAQVAGWQVLSIDYAAVTGQRDALAADRLAALRVKRVRSCKIAFMYES